MKRTLSNILTCLDGSQPTPLRTVTPLGQSLVAGSCLVSVLAKNREGADKTLCCSANIDSRVQASDSLFFCFEGETTDGHLYAANAVENGAVAIIGTRNPFASDSPPPVPVLLVNNTLHALWRIALLQRAETRAKVAGITGTAGKTTVKEVLASVLAVEGRTAKNHKNLNTQIGLALSMINAEVDDSFWVLETGISKPHDMEELGSILQPDVSIILNAGNAHAEGLGERGVAWHKARLAAYTVPGGTALVNADYPELLHEAQNVVRQLAGNGSHLKFFASANADADCRAEYLGYAPASPANDTERAAAYGLFRITLDNSATEYKAPFIGSYGAENTAAIVATATLFGLSTEAIQRGLLAAELPEMRFSCVDIGGVTVIDDTYNANPLSSARMIETAYNLATATDRPLILVMGKMGELGAKERELHFQLGAHMGNATPAAVFWHGDFMHEVMAGLVSAHHTCPFTPTASAEEFLRACTGLVSLCPDAVVLFKGSRSNKLETYVRAFHNVLAQETQKLSRNSRELPSYEA